MACESNTSAVNRGTPISAFSRIEVPWTRAVCRVTGTQLGIREREISGGLGSLALVSEPFGLVEARQRVNNGLQPSFHGEVQLMKSEADPVVGNPVLRE